MRIYVLNILGWWVKQDTLVNLTKIKMIYEF